MPQPNPKSAIVPFDPADQVAFAQQVLEAEAQAIEHIRLDQTFGQAVDLILTTAGSVVVSGLGKSGLIGQKLSATFASTGTPSLFLHPTEAMHGDLGRVRRGDLVIVLSYGGNTDEVVTLAELLRQDDVAVIALCAKRDCDLGRIATLTLCIGEVTEACSHHPAPTASTTAMLALGDALALTVSRRRNFGVEDFRKVHPGGGLGRQLTPVVEAMRFHVSPGESVSADERPAASCSRESSQSPPAKAGSPGNLPLIDRRISVKDAYAQAERYAQNSGLRRAGALLIVDDAGSLAGIVTDGDLRTALIRQGPEVWSGAIDAIMTAHPTTLPDSALVRDAVRIVRERRFDEIPIVDGHGKPVGLIDVQDLAALKVIEG